MRRTWTIAAIATALATSLAACDAASPDAPPTTADTRKEVPPVAEATPGATAPQTLDAGTAEPIPTRCEELGELNASNIAAVIDGGEQWFWGPLVARPNTRIGVIATAAAKTTVGSQISLATSIESNWQTCTHCIAVVVGCNGDDCSQATWFVAASGSARFDALATAAGEAFESRFDDVVLQQVTVDPATYHSTPAPGGGCFHLTKASFSAVTQKLGPVEGPPGSDGGTEGTDGGTGGNSHGGGGGSKGGADTGKPR